MFDNLAEQIIERWYPLVIDNEFGGYFTNITYDWKIVGPYDKMIVSQARHVWTLSKVASFLSNKDEYTKAAYNGYKFLKNKMWDNEYGGFFQTRNRKGDYSSLNGWNDEKRTYGNAFGIYALASLYKLTNDEEILSFAKDVFYWIEKNAYDSYHKGYFQFLLRNGNPFGRDSEYKSESSDKNEVGFKDQNSSIHLLEAYTELYNVWKEDYLKEQLKSLLQLIRDTITTDKGYLQLFFYEDWTPVSFKDADDKTRKENYALDHVSFGHDYETAFLMLEAAYSLNDYDDTKTLFSAKKMLDHAIKFGFDSEIGGFYDCGYYFQGDNNCTVIKDTKNWWAQAEGLNALLIFSRIFPEETIYYQTFLKQWDYIKKYILDYENGDWFEGGLDKEPHFKKGPKSHIWKCTYHTGRALMNCISLLADENFKNEKLGESFISKGEEWEDFINYWKRKAVIDKSEYTA